MRPNLVTIKQLFALLFVIFLVTPIALQCCFHNQIAAAYLSSHPHQHAPSVLGQLLHQNHYLQLDQVIYILYAMLYLCGGVLAICWLISPDPMMGQNHPVLAKALHYLCFGCVILFGVANVATISALLQQLTT